MDLSRTCAFGADIMMFLNRAFSASITSPTNGQRTLDLKKEIKASMITYYASGNSVQLYREP